MNEEHESNLAQWSQTLIVLHFFLILRQLGINYFTNVLFKN